MKKILFITFVVLISFPAYAVDLRVVGPEEELAEIEILGNFVFSDEIRTATIPQAKQTQATAAQWAELFAATDASDNVGVYGARLCSPERSWPAVRDQEVPADWPESTITEDEVTRQKLIYEYALVYRSKLNPTRAVTAYNNPMQNVTISGGALQPGYWFYNPLTDDLLKKYRALFVGYKEWSWCKAWYQVNITDVE